MLQMGQYLFRYCLFRVLFVILLLKLFLHSLNLFRPTDHLPLSRLLGIFILLLHNPSSRLEHVHKGFNHYILVLICDLVISGVIKLFLLNSSFNSDEYFNFLPLFYYILYVFRLYVLDFGPFLLFFAEKRLIAFKKLAFFALLRICMCLDILLNFYPISH